MITNWRKSSRSMDKGDCVEVGGQRIGATTVVGVRDTKARGAGQLGFSGQAWSQFLTSGLGR